MVGVVDSPMRDTTSPQSDFAALSVEQLAHELNSLLDGATRSVRLILSRIASDEVVDPIELHGRLERVQDAMRRMSAVLEGAMGQHGRGGPPVARTVGEVLREVSEALEPLAEIDGVTMQMRIADEARDLPAGPLAVVLLNGLKNAIEAAAESPVGVRLVELDALREGDEIIIRIVDSGRGFDGPPRAGQSGKSRGHGIGLPLSQQLIERAGGRLRLANERTGALFEVALPCGTNEQRKLSA